VVGTTIEAAHKRAANLEEAAVATYRALTLGDTTTECPPEYLERVRLLEAEAGG
jgi:L-fuculose-phosphate aldolase